MNLNEIIRKLSGKMEHIPNSLEWEEREFLEKNSQEALPRLFDVIKTIDTSDYAGYDVASQILRVTKDVCFRAENFKIAEDKLDIFVQFLQLYDNEAIDDLPFHLHVLESILNSIFKILEYCPSHGNIILIMNFVNSNHFQNLPEGINNSILSALHKIVRLSNNPRNYEEELAMDICREIMKATNSENVGVYVQATHGCVEHRGIEAHSSLTQTTVLEGAFATDPATKKEFMDNIKLQQQFAPK